MDLEPSSEETAPSTKENSEQNRAFTLSRKATLLECVIFHFLPVATTIGVLPLSFLSIYWADPTAYSSFNEVLNSLQYASKALEILMNLSISRILLHRTRFLLVKKALPLGFVAVGYAPTLSNIMRPDFWTSVQPRYKPPTNWLMATLPSISLVIWCVFLMLVAGPSLAVAVLPGLDWWSTDPFQNMRVSTWVRDLDGLQLWPTNLTADSIYNKQYFENGADQVYTCPSQNWQSVQYWTENIRWRRTSPNLTIKVQLFNAQRYLISSSDNTWNSDWTYVHVFHLQH